MTHQASSRAALTTNPLEERSNCLQIWGPHRVSLTSTEYIEPIDIDLKTFTFEVTAPASAGNYNFQWRMVQDYVEWFGGYTPNAVVQVVDALPNDAQYVSQSVASPRIAGQTYQASVMMKNLGTNTWTAANNFRPGFQNPQDNHIWNGGRVGLSVGDSIAPGASKTFNYSVTAPAFPGNYNFQWRMLQEYVEWFGENSSNIVVTVVTMSTLTTSTTTTTTSSTSTSTTTSSSTSTTTTTTSTTTSSTTTTSSSSSLSTMSTTINTTTTSTTIPHCIMPWNYPPCDVVSLSEAVDGIYEWVGGNPGMGEVIDLIDSWVDPSKYPAS